jgi:hypothetical protein
MGSPVTAQDPLTQEGWARPPELIVLYANNLTGALLMYHGMDDQNVGTHPINSTRLFHALNGLGKTASLYMYPYEDHGPATVETTLDLWARWVAWLDKYVKNGGRDEPRVTLEQ